MYFVHVGQCGNQVGYEFWKIMHAERLVSPQSFKGNCFFNSKGQANALLIDAEPKVIDRIIKSTSTENNNKGLFSQSRIAYEQSGCGNNWALGYYTGGNNYLARNKISHRDNDPTAANELLAESIKLLQTQLFDLGLDSMIKAIFVFHSLSGGTGSGLGCAIIEKIKKIYPQILVFSVCVAPFFSTGDTPLQYYNCLLAITHLHKFADSIILFQNDGISKILVKRTSSTQTKYSSKNTSHSTEDINKYIASCLVQIMLPTKCDNGNWKQFDPSDLIKNVCPEKDTKFVEIHTSAILLVGSRMKMTSWQYIVEEFMKKTPQYDLDNRVIQSINSQIFLRGNVGNEFQIIHALVSKLIPHVPWNIEPLTYKLSASPALKSHRIDEAITLVYNRTHVVELLDLILRKAFVMLETKAYLHWYSRYGCDLQYMSSCFETLQEIIANYVRSAKE